jgi:hypothetical protein
MNGCPKCIDKITPKRKILKVKPLYVNRKKEINKISSSALHTLTKTIQNTKEFLKLKSQIPKHQQKAHQKNGS